MRVFILLLLLSTVFVVSASAQQTCSARCPDGSLSEVFDCDSDYIPVCLRRQAPVYVDPRIAQANNLFALGQQAFSQKDYEKAADYFGQANVVYPDDAYRKAQNTALATADFARGLDAFSRHNWALAIAQFQHSQIFEPNEAASENIKRAHSYQSWDYGQDAWNAKNYDLAIRYFQEADSWWHDPALAELIRKVQASKLEDAAIGAMRTRNFALAEMLFTKELTLAPGSKYALSRRADAIAEQARDAANQGGDIDAVIAAFDRAFASYDAARTQLGGRGDLVNYAWAHNVAAAALVKLARSKDDWAKIVSAHQRWLSLSGGDPDAAHALAYVNGERAGHAVNRGLSQQDFQAAQSSAEEALRVDPDNKYAQRVETFARAQQGRAAETASIVASMKTSAVEAGTSNWAAVRQAMQAWYTQRDSPKLPNRCPWDSGVGCSAAGAVSRPQSSAFPPPAAFLPPNEETPQQHELHQQIEQQQSKMKGLTAKLAQTTDPVERTLIKQDIIAAKSEADTSRVKYDDITRAHRINKR